MVVGTDNTFHAGCIPVVWSFVLIIVLSSVLIVLGVLLFWLSVLVEDGFGVWVSVGVGFGVTLLASIVGASVTCQESPPSGIRAYEVSDTRGMSVTWSISVSPNSKRKVDELVSVNVCANFFGKMTRKPCAAIALPIGK
jgi:hypothetical protein